MKKLINGILDFRTNVLPQRRELFTKLAVGQAPDVLFIACSDSRVAPNWFASTDPGDLFVVRNVGNLVPPCIHKDDPEAEHSVAAAIEFSVIDLKVKDIIVCGHSSCGAVHALATGIEKLAKPHLKYWLRYAEPLLKTPFSTLHFDAGLSHEDRLSQQNVLLQIAHLKTYPTIERRLRTGEIQLHAWWFEIAEGSVYAYDEPSQKFLLVDGTHTGDVS